MLNKELVEAISKSNVKSIEFVGGYGPLLSLDDSDSSSYYSRKQVRIAHMLLNMDLRNRKGFPIRVDFYPNAKNSYVVLKSEPAPKFYDCPDCGKVLAKDLTITNNLDVVCNHIHLF